MHSEFKIKALNYFEIPNYYLIFALNKLSRRIAYACNKSWE